MLTPDTRETTLARRGFPVKDEASRQVLETVGARFLTGFGYAAQARTPTEAADRLETVPWQWRGFAYEGAAMALAIMDGLPLGGGGRVAAFLAGRADRHTYMVHVGAGWAMARLPRWRWHAVIPADPLLRWLALDGYGFHQAYFHTDRYVRRQHPIPVRWPDDPSGVHAARVVDQGIGRALWFVTGTDVDLLARTINAFAPGRRGDLYCGAALAATYAGGASEDELSALRRYGSQHAPVMAQGSAFAAKARVRAGLVTPHTGVATSVFCGMNPHEAAAVTDAVLASEGLLRREVGAGGPDPSVPPRTRTADLPGGTPLPAYQLWRQRIADQMVSLGRC
jgi:hypothetical protein